MYIAKLTYCLNLVFVVATMPSRYATSFFNKAEHSDLIASSGNYQATAVLTQQSVYIPKLCT